MTAKCRPAVILWSKVFLIVDLVRSRCGLTRMSTHWMSRSSPCRLASRQNQNETDPLRGSYNTLRRFEFACRLLCPSQLPWVSPPWASALALQLRALWPFLKHLLQTWLNLHFGQEHLPWLKRKQIFSPWA